MKEFCKDIFWDLNEIWETTNPKFSECFHQTVISWIAPLFLFLFFPVEIFKSKRKLEGSAVLLDALSVSKAVIAVILIVLSALEGAYIEDYDILADYIKVGVIIASFALSLGLHIYSLLRRSTNSSTLQFFFYLLFTLSSVITLRRAVLSEDTTHIWIISLRTGFCFVGVCLYSISETTFRKKPIGKNECPKKKASFLSKTFYEWSTPLLWKGYRSPIKEDDLWELSSELTSTEVSKYFDQRYHSLPEEKRKIGSSLIKSFGGKFLIVSIYKLLNDIMSMLLPQIMKLMIAHVESQENIRQPWKGYLYAFLLLVISVLQSIFLSWNFEMSNILCMKIRTALTSVIYRKCLKLSNSARKNKSVGEIVNVMSVDVSRIADILPYLSLIWSSPFQIFTSIFFIYNELGWAVLAGVGTILLTIPFNIVMGSFTKKYQLQQMKIKDKRVNLVNEILSGIRILKLYAWEPSRILKVKDIRLSEINILRKVAWVSSGIGFAWSLTPFIFALASFAAFVLMDDANILTADKAFVTISYVNSMKIALGAFPFLLIALISATVSAKRINELLQSDELQNDAIEKIHQKNGKTTGKTHAVLIQKASFKWGPTDKKPTLEDIDMKVLQGEFIAIVGSVGCGKTSLISGLLGEMHKDSGRVQIRGQIAYVPQEAWMQNTSLKNNILFGKPYDEEWYNKVLEYCCLSYDLSLLPGGDETEIGERGINLSGGQKQRISIARAVYSDADIYLFDDPLSAVDAHVGKTIFNNIFNPKIGLLRHKTRILVTHGITYIPQADSIYVIKDGKISDVGTYEELSKKKIIQMIAQEEKNQSKNHNEEDKNLDPKEKKAEEEKSTLIEKESIETGRVSWIVYKYYILKFGALGILMVIISQLAFHGCSFASGVWVDVWTNGTLGDSSIKQNRDLYLGVYGAFGVAQAIAIFISTLSVGLLSLKASKIIHNEAYDQIMRAPTSFFDSTPQGRILNRFSKDIGVADSILAPIIRQWISCFFNFAGTIILIVSVIPLFILLGIPTAIVFIIVQNIYVASSRQLKRLESVTRSPIYSHFSESLSGLSTIRAYGVQKQFITESNKKVDFNQKCFYPSIMANRWLAMRLENIANLITFGAALITVTSSDLLSPGKVGLILSYALAVTQILNWLVRQTAELETNIVAIERLKEYSDAATEDEWRKGKSLTNIWPSKGKIEFVDYSLRYRSELDTVLKHINLRIEGGERVGIVGRTGAGKSSLTVALFRVVEADSGKIVIDGKDIASLGLHDLREALTIIPQEPVLFSGTLRENLDPHDSFSDQEIWTALHCAHLTDFVSGLQDTLGHVISEGGSNLSAGQRQLICLARALLRSCKILILDEATAAVDWETDEKIQHTIRTYFPNSTILTIAHRLNTIIDYDKILVLEQGSVKQFASPKVLFNDKESAFRSMLLAAGITSLDDEGKDSMISKL